MILFFIRRYNDIDHLVPLIWKLVSQGVPVRVLSLEPLLDLDNDYRLAFLRTRAGVNVGQAYHLHAPTWGHRLAAALLCGRLVQRATTKRAGDLWRRRSAIARFWWLELLLMPLLFAYRGWAYAWLYERVWRPLCYGRAWADGLLAKLAPALLVFDWVPKRKFMIADLIDAAHARGVKAIAVPHGVHVISDELRGDRATRAGQVKRSWPLAVYDAVAVPEPLFREFLIKAGLSGDRVDVIGSARFCAEWERVHDTILPPTKIPRGLGDGTLKVVYMDKSFRSRMDPKAVVGTLRAIAGLPGVTLIIKPETRGNTPASREMETFATIGTDHTSLDLIRWADVVIGTVSSILLEVLVQDKILIYPVFFSENVTFFQDYGACWAVDTPEALFGALERLSKDRSFRPYPRENAERLLADVVYGGHRDRDVLGRYRDFLLRHAALERPAAVATAG